MFWNLSTYLCIHWWIPRNINNGKANCAIFSILVCLSNVFLHGVMVFLQKFERNTQGIWWTTWTITMVRLDQLSYYLSVYLCLSVWHVDIYLFMELWSFWKIWWKFQNYSKSGRNIHLSHWKMTIYCYLPEYYWR